VIRIALGIVLAGLFAVGCYLLLLGTLLHFDSDGSDPFFMKIGRVLWLMYLASLDLLWGVSATAMLWPGQRSDRLRRMLGYGTIAAVVSGAVLTGVAYINDHGRFYVELAALVLVSGLVIGIWQVRPVRHTAT